MSRDSAVGIAIGYRLEEFKSQWGQEFSLLHVVQSSSGAHPDSYPWRTVCSIPRGKAAWA
jgi:hypothetical protein